MPSNHQTKLVCLGLFAFVAIPSETHAGMTVYGLRDIYRLRLEEISFFLVLIPVCAFALKLLWNFAFKDVALIPRLRFVPALCMAVLFGLMTLLILTMISGIREILTPGAWRHQGTSYRLNDSAQEPARWRSLQQLRDALFHYAQTHAGRFPEHDFAPEIPDKIWESPDQAGTHYIYVGGRTTNDLAAVIAFEPPAFGARRLVLKGSGEIQMMSSAELNQPLKAATRK